MKTNPQLVLQKTEWEFFLVDLDKVRETGDLVESTLFHLSPSASVSNQEEEILFKCGSLVSALEFNFASCLEGGGDGATDLISFGCGSRRSAVLRSDNVILFVVANESSASRSEQKGSEGNGIKDHIRRRLWLYNNSMAKAQWPSAAAAHDDDVVFQVRNDLANVLDLLHGGLTRWRDRFDVGGEFADQLKGFINQYLWLHRSSLPSGNDPDFRDRCRTLMDDIICQNNIVVGGVILRMDSEEDLWSLLFSHPPEMSGRLSRWMACAAMSRADRFVVPCPVHHHHHHDGDDPDVVRPLTGTSLISLHYNESAREDLELLEKAREEGVDRHPWTAAAQDEQDFRWHLLPRDYGSRRSRRPADSKEETFCSPCCYSLLTMNLGRSRLTLILNSCANVVTNAQIRFVFFTSVARLGTIDNYNNHDDAAGRRQTSELSNKLAAAATRNIVRYENVRRRRKRRKKSGNAPTEAPEKLMEGN